MTKRPTIVSGMQPTGALHLGNYLGALKQWIELQNSGDYDCFFFLVDLHALTVPRDPKELREKTLMVAAEYIAAGLDPKKSTIFLQSQVHEHAELAWIFDTITPLGELERMTQFKDKSKLGAENINAGLLTYPCLMAADILLYKPVMVPVGDDQTQHLELTRMISKKFNKRFGNTFPEPKNFALKPLRIMSLAQPEKKMSKTGDEALMLSDPPEEIMRKLKKAVTASDGKHKSAGVENLLFLLRHFGTQEQIEFFEDAVNDGSVKYSELKQTLAKQIADHFATFRDRRDELLAHPDHIMEILADGARKAKVVAHETLLEVKQKIGLL
jgi:tryptophanyl-tRNA synthetase